MNLDMTQLEAGLRAGATVDWGGALAALKSGDVDRDFQSVEDLLSVLAVFFPQAAAIKDGIMVMELVFNAYRAGLIKSASVESPAMERAAGHSTPGMG